MRLFRKIQNERGSSMVEVLGVLAFLATISVGVYATIASAHGKLRTTRGYEETKRIVKAMRDQFSAFTPPNTDANTLYELGIFENISSNSDGSSVGVNTMGHKMEITLPSSDTSVFAAMDKTFKLTYYEVDRKTCVALLLADWGSDQSSGLAEISTGGTTFRWPKDHSTGTYHPLPVETKDAMTECSRQNQVNISWEFFL